MSEEEKPEYEYTNDKKIYYPSGDSKRKEGARYLKDLNTEETQVFIEYANNHSSGAPFLAKNGNRYRLIKTGSGEYEIE